MVINANGVPSIAKSFGTFPFFAFIQIKCPIIAYKAKNSNSLAGGVEYNRKEFKCLATSLLSMVLSKPRPDCYEVSEKEDEWSITRWDEISGTAQILAIRLLCEPTCL